MEFEYPLKKISGKPKINGNPIKLKKAELEISNNNILGFYKIFRAGSL